MASLLGTGIRWSLRRKSRAAVLQSPLAIVALPYLDTRLSLRASHLDARGRLHGRPRIIFMLHFKDGLSQSASLIDDKSSS